MRAMALYFMPDLVRQDDHAGNGLEYLMPFLVRRPGFPHVVPASSGVPAQVFDLMKRVQVELPAGVPRAQLSIKTYFKMMLVLLVNHYAAYRGVADVVARKERALERLRPLFDHLDAHVAEPGASVERHRRRVVGTHTHDAGRSLIGIAHGPIFAAPRREYHGASALDSPSKSVMHRRHTALFVALLVGNTLLAAGDALWEAAAVTSVVSIAPLIASIRLSARWTGVVGGYSVVLAILLGIPNHNIGTLSHSLRVLVCIVIAIAAVVIARLRAQREAAVGDARAARDQLKTESSRALPTACSSRPHGWARVRERGGRRPARLRARSTPSLPHRFRKSWRAPR